MERSLPPSARRLALARRAGLVLTSPAVTAALALAAGVAAAAAAIAVSAAAIAALARDGWSRAAGSDAVPRALATDATALAGRTLGLTAPVLAAAAAAALLATAVLARGLVVPRRSVRGAPADPDDAAARATDALVGLARTAALATVALAFLVDRLPALARLASLPATAVAPALRAHGLAALAHVAVAAIAASALELAVRAGRRHAALRMTVREARDERRETAGEPTAQRRRRAAGRTDARDRLVDALVLVVADDVAAAIGWRPGGEPRVLARARGLEARALQTAARARAVPIAFAPALAALAPGAVPPAAQPALAALVASLRLTPR